MAAERFEMRAASADDAAAIARFVHELNRGYASFMGAGWQPPTVEWATADLERTLPRPGVRTRLALSEADGSIVAFCAWTPARTEQEPREPIPGVAYLWMLFVERSRWGSGLGSDLHSWATGGMRAAGYDRARLWTPTGQVRARAFYERGGWRVTGRERDSKELRLPVVEYELELG